MKRKTTLDVLYEMHKLINIAKDEGAGKFFTMEYWRLQRVSCAYLETCPYKGANDCGTHGCLLGWIVYYAEKTNSFLSPENFKDVWYDYGFSFSGYYKKIIPELVKLQIPDELDDQVYWTPSADACDYLFDGDWVDHRKTNTIDHAIERLENIIACVESGELAI